MPCILPSQASQLGTDVCTLDLLGGVNCTCSYCGWHAKPDLSRQEQSPWYATCRSVAERELISRASLLVTWAPVQIQHAHLFVSTLTEGQRRSNATQHNRARACVPVRARARGCERARVAASARARGKMPTRFRVVGSLIGSWPPNISGLFAIIHIAACYQFYEF